MARVTQKSASKARSGVKTRNRPSVRKTTSKLKKELDAVFSKYIRQKYSQDGYVRCYTCDKILEVSAAHCGHFVSRLYLATRWEEDNCRPQCVDDNIFGRGQILEFEERLTKELGASRVQELKESRKQILTLKEAFYLEKISHYKSLLP